MAQFWRQNLSKINEKTDPKIDAEKVMKIDAKRVENDAKTEPQIDDF